MAKATRIDREKKTVATMLQLYCKKQHKTTQALCPDCEGLLHYAHKRLDHCVFGALKTVCGDCPIHCYKKEMREKIQQVMRYSGPRMFFSHPIMAIQHILDKRKKATP